MKNKIIFGLFVGCLLVLAGCSQEYFPEPGSIAREGEAVTVRFKAAIPAFNTVQTRAGGGVNDLHLLVFNEEGIFITREQAALANQTETGGEFTAELPSSSDKRIIHFVANLEAFDDQPGANEAAVAGTMQTQNTAFWARVELDNGISATSFEGKSVELLRNQAKVSVASTADNFNYEGFTLHQIAEKGTVAPFSAAAGFTEGTITEPSGVALLEAVEADISGDEKYLFERKNASATNITTVIVKGTYLGESYYYKIDLIDGDKNRYDIQRNWHYAVTIQSVTRAGYKNFDDALQGASHNNTALDPIIEKYPMISDGTSKLEVEKTLVILNSPGQAFQVWAKYFPDIDKEDVDNSSVTVSLQKDNEALDPASLSFDAATGIISAKAIGGTLPREPKEARITVSKGELARVVRVVLREPFIFKDVTINNQNPGVILNGQSQDAVLRFDIPEEFPDDLFPLPIQIHTQGLYPAATGLEMVVEKGQIYYIYRATRKGTQVINFKTNQSGNTETVTLTADYFTDGRVPYDIIRSISGKITYGDTNGTITPGTPFPSGIPISVSTGTISITSAGEYVYSMPDDYKDNTMVTFSYEKQVNTHYKERYSHTISIGDLFNNSNINMQLHQFIFEGTMQHYRSNRFRDVPSSGTVSIDEGPGSIEMTATGKYRYTAPGSTTDNTEIRFRYIRSLLSNYYQTKSIKDLKENAALELREQ